MTKRVENKRAHLRELQGLSMLLLQRASTLTAKLNLLRGWLLQLKEAGTEIDVVIIDTANPLFRGRQSPNDETTAGEFFDRLANLPAKLKIFGFGDEEDAQSQRGSGQFADVPDLLLQLRRPDKRVDRAMLEVTKFRHGSKPAPFDVWFDHLEFRLIPYPPVVHLLHLGPATREELITGLKAHFNIGHNAAEEQLRSAKETRLVVETQKGHRKLLSIDLRVASTRPEEGDYWYERYERIWGGRVQDPVKFQSSWKLCPCPRESTKRATVISFIAIT